MLHLSQYQAWSFFWATPRQLISGHGGAYENRTLSWRAFHPLMTNFWWYLCWVIAHSWSVGFVASDLYFYTWIHGLSFVVTDSYLHWLLFFIFAAKPPVFGPCRLLDFELEMVGLQTKIPDEDHLLLKLEKVQKQLIVHSIHVFLSML